MMKRRSLPALAAALTLALASIPAHADDPKQEAGKHFEHGVTLSSEADYAAALVEFRRAYDIAPNPLVLYNIGQTYFQLRNYAAALTYFERYLAESAGQTPHAAEVEQSIVTLRARVGTLDVTSNVAGGVFIDDELQGQTPQNALRISVGRHRVAVRPAGLEPQERTIEVSAGDSVPLTFAFSASKPTTSAPGAAVAPPPAESPQRGLRPVATALWITTGVLTAGAVVTGIVALSTGGSLDSERDSATASRDQLDSLHGRMRALSITTDVLVGTALVAGGVALYFTLSKPKSPTQSALGISPQGLQLRLTY